ncbi:MAG: T9SS type A sorting domain-containing protein [Chitinophagales bacterium]|nr:T9SS type A sorting domain-containing protein [Chitinophagales bacterium]
MGGIRPFHYLWNNGNTSDTASNLIVGTYSVTDADSNSLTSSVTIAQPAQLIVTTTDVTPTTSCFGTTDGSAKAFATGGTPPYNFLGGDGQTGSSASQFFAGTYFVSVTDSLGCIDTASINIQEGPIITVGSISRPDMVSINGIAYYSIDTGYIYNWIVTNGNIPSGDSTNSIVVNWTIGGQSILQVIVSEQSCIRYVTKKITVIYPVGIDSYSFNNSSLHPNPTNKTITLTAQNIQTQATLTLVDALGKEVWQKTFFAEALKAGVPLSLKEQEQGIYFLSIHTTSGSRVMKVGKY